MKRLKTLDRVCYVVIKNEFERVVLRDYFLVHGRRTRFTKITDNEILKVLDIDNEVVYSMS